MNTHIQKKLLKYIIHIIDNVINKENNDYNEYYITIFNMINSLQITDIESNKKFYKYLFNEIDISLKRHILNINNDFNLNFNLMIYENRWTEMYDKCVKLDTIFKFLNYKTKTYLGKIL